MSRSQIIKQHLSFDYSTRLDDKHDAELSKQI